MNFYETFGFIHLVFYTGLGIFTLFAWIMRGLKATGEDYTMAQKVKSLQNQYKAKDYEYSRN